MGSFNYKTSDYITLAIEPYSFYDLKNDAAFMQEITELDCSTIQIYGNDLYIDDYRVVNTYDVECITDDVECITDDE